MLPKRFIREAFRPKTFHAHYIAHSDLPRSVGLIDLVGIAIISSVSFSTFVLVPSACRDIAGPSTTIAALLIFVAMLIAGMHYCEVTLRFPKAGSLYVASYAVFGEITAFLIGWLTLVDYAVCIAYAAHEWSTHTQYLFNHSLRENINETSLEDGFDYLAVLGIVGTATFVTCSMKIVGVVSLVLGVITALIVSSTVLVGFFYADSINWITSGFFPNGFSGVLRAAGKLSSGFLAFEVYSSIAEECTRVARVYPILMPVGIFLTFLFMFLMAAVTTLTTPYYNIVKNVPLPALFGQISVPASRYVLSVGSVCGLTGTLAILQLPAARILHSMAEDGLLPSVFKRTLRRSGSPAVSVILVDLIASALCYIPTSWYSSLPPDLSLSGNTCLSYEKFRRRDGKLYSYTYVDSNGSIVSAAQMPLDSDYSLADSVTSSCVVGNMKALAIIDPSITPQEETALSPSHRAPQAAKAEPENTGSTYGSTLNVQQSGHVCENSPCSQNSDDFRAHEYDREVPDVPYYNAFDAIHGRSDSCNTLPKHSLKETYALTGTFAALTTTLAATVTFAGAAIVNLRWWAICIALGLSLAVVGVAVGIGRQPIPGTSLPKQVPGLPVTSLAGACLLTFIAMAAPWRAIASTAAILVPGGVIYCIYGRRKSNERAFHKIPSVPIQFSKESDGIVENTNTALNATLE